MRMSVLEQADLLRDEMELDKLESNSENESAYVKCDKCNGEGEYYQQVSIDHDRLVTCARCQGTGSMQRRD